MAPPLARTCTHPSTTKGTPRSCSYDGAVKKTWKGKVTMNFIKNLFRRGRHHKPRTRTFWVVWR